MQGNDKEIYLIEFKRIFFQNWFELKEMEMKMNILIIRIARNSRDQK